MDSNLELRNFKKNHEGYNDPTAYQALRNIERRERTITKKPRKLVKKEGG
jgi:hypothetical protein